MRKIFSKRRLKSIILAAILGLLTLPIITGGLFVYQLDQEMLQKMEQKKVIQPTIFYSRAPSWKVGDVIALEALVKSFKGSLRNRDQGVALFPGDYRLLQGELCRDVLPLDVENLDATDFCFQIFWSEGEGGRFRDPWLETLWTDGGQVIKGIYEGKDLTPLSQFVLRPQIIAQYLGGDPILYEQTPLNKIPIDCLNSIIAIEDAKFLEHGGVSVLGILRAVVVNLVKGRKAQGGSTLTQQMVKNYFLTPEKTIKRKFIEFIMALLIENRFDKDLILETYLNIIYMGQQGPYQIRGYGAAANHYFQKNVSQLSLGQCGLLAAIVNSPGQFDPFKNPQKARDRRDTVLHKMLEQKLITEKEKAMASAEALPADQNVKLYSTLPYFLQGVVEQTKKLGIEDLAGYRLFTTLDLGLQEAAQAAVKNNLENLETTRPLIKKLKETQKKQLEGALVSVDLQTGQILSLVGGRSYKTTQFNRILSARRQVGSTFKPIVFLTALEEEDDLNPLSELKDLPFTHTYGRQKWTPNNYDKQFFGKVPLYFSLKESLNLATSQLAIEIGLDNIVNMAHRLGIESELKSVPSLSLGALELYPLELLQAYSTMARFGSHRPLTFLDSVYDSSGEKVWSVEEQEDEQRVDEESAEVLVGMMKLTAQTGTAHRIKDSGFTKTVAGKTGTTNDNKDSWFVGFTPEILTLVWTGYDDNTSTGLTGAGGALPAWIEYMETATKFHRERDFPWTDGVETRTISLSDLISDGFWDSKAANEPEEINLVFKK